MIGVDTDQAPMIDERYKEGICITSAMKGIRQTVIAELQKIRDEKWESGNKILGLVSSEDPELNYVQLPLETWRMKKVN